MIIAFYDIETTGFSREHNDIIEIAAVAWNSETNEEIGNFSQYIKPMAPIPAQITELTGITMDMVANQPNFWIVAPQFFVWLQEMGVQRMCGYNSDVFDWPFINAQIDRYKLRNQYTFKVYEQLDLMKTVRALEKSNKLHLKAWCLTHGYSKLSVKQTIVAEYFGIKYVAHDAINDCRALKDIYMHLRNIDFNLM